MKPAASESALAGVLVIDKPTGLTSHDVVQRLRRTLQTRRVGHAGTLDPLASGVLVVMIGAAYLAAFASDMDEAESAALVAEVMAVMSDPAFAPVFGAGSRAEVPSPLKSRSGLLPSQT